MIPEKLKGTELEKEILTVVKGADDVTGNRYGVMVRFDPDGNSYRPIKSYPDIEGVIRPYGQQFIIECKVCSAASLQLASRISDDKQSKQLAHMLQRADFGATCFYCVHFNRRDLKTKSVAAYTFAMPVHPCHPYWLGFLGGFETKLNIEICQEYGVEIEWVIPPRCRKPRINIVPAIEEIDEIVQRHRNKQPVEWRSSEIFKLVGTA